VDLASLSIQLTRATKSLLAVFDETPERRSRAVVLHDASAETKLAADAAKLGEVGDPTAWASTLTKIEPAGLRWTEPMSGGIGRRRKPSRGDRGKRAKAKGALPTLIQHSPDEPQRDQKSASSKPFMLNKLLHSKSCSKCSNARVSSLPDIMEATSEFRRSVTRLSRLLGASMPKGELTPTKLTALSILRREGPLSASTLASRLGILLADLEREELLTRTRDARDGREHILEPTAKARSLMQAEGIRRNAIIRETMQRALTPIEIDLLFVAAKAINKLADAWSAPDKFVAREQEASE
jgi:DNA-binding MarR family transcriptional regulator